MAKNKETQAKKKNISAKSKIIAEPLTEKSGDHSEDNLQEVMADSKGSKKAKGSSITATKVTADTLSRSSGSTLGPRRGRGRPPRSALPVEIDAVPRTKTSGTGRKGNAKPLPLSDRPSVSVSGATEGTPSEANVSGTGSKITNNKGQFESTSDEDQQVQDTTPSPETLVKKSKTKKTPKKSTAVTSTKKDISGESPEARPKPSNQKYNAKKSYTKLKVQEEETVTSSNDTEGEDEVSSTEVPTSPPRFTPRSSRSKSPKEVNTSPPSPTEVGCKKKSGLPPKKLYDTPSKSGVKSGRPKRKALSSHDIEQTLEQEEVAPQEKDKVAPLEKKGSKKKSPAKKKEKSTPPSNQNTVSCTTPRSTTKKCLSLKKRKANDSYDTDPTPLKKVKKKILGVLIESKREEAAINKMYGIKDSQGNVIEVSSDDNSQEDIDEVQDKTFTDAQNSFTDVDSVTDRVQHKKKKPQEEAENDGSVESEDEDDLQSESLDLSTHSTRLRMVLQDTSIFEDPTKSHDSWFSEDTTAEAGLCELWREEVDLYDPAADGYKKVDRNQIFKRWSTVLKIPPNVISTRMNSLRNAYQKMHKGLKSGAEPEKLSPRNAEIKRLLFFLRQHVKTAPSLCSYTSQPPATSTPINPLKRKATEKEPEEDQEEEHEDEDEQQEVPDDSLHSNSNSPMAQPVSPQSQNDEGTETHSLDDFVVNTKSYSHNARLNDPKVRKYLKQNSPRLSHDDTSKVMVSGGKKSLDKSKIKSSSKDKRVQESTSSCRDTAPKAKLPTADTTKKSSTQKSLPKKATAAIKTTKASSGTEAPPTTAKERVAILQAARRASDKKDNRVTPHQVPSNSAERKAMMERDVPNYEKAKEYSVDIPWYNQQGSEFRKKKEGGLLRAQREHQSEMSNYMKEKNETLKLLAGNISTLKPTAPSTSVVEQDKSPQMKWALVIVDQLARMTPEKQDDFMLHVSGLAVQAIRNKWP